MQLSRTAVSSVLVSCAFVCAAAADVINVPGDAPTIQAAIDRAATGDEIVVAPGTYAESVNFRSKALTLRSTAGAAATIIDGQNRPAFVVIAGGSREPSTIDGFTIRGGRWSGNGTGPGGGLSMQGGAVTVTNSMFTRNVAYSGGAIAVSGGTLTIRDCRFEDNRALNGTSIYGARSTVRIEGSTFVRNGSVTNDGDGTGYGGVRADGGSLEIVNSTFTENTGSWGAAIYTNGARVLIDGVTAYRNGGFEAPGTFYTFNGGAASFLGGSGTVRNSVFTSNRSAAGSALYFASAANFTVVNNVLNANVGGLFGAAIYAGDGTSPRIINNTFANNQSGAVVTRYFSNPIITNNIIWREDFPRRDPNASIDVFGNGTGTISYTLLQGRFYAPIPGAGNVSAAPEFADADGEDNIPGTLDDNFALVSGSPGVDAGNSRAVPAGVLTDLAGSARFADDQATPDSGAGDAPIVDMGAFELQGAGRCIADFNGDSMVDHFDYRDFVQAFEDGDVRSDIDGDGSIDFFDYMDFVDAFTTGC
jgi:hypothetical protein